MLYWSFVRLSKLSAVIVVLLFIGGSIVVYQRGWVPPLPTPTPTIGQIQTAYKTRLDGGESEAREVAQRFSLVIIDEEDKLHLATAMKEENPDII